jgi:hypothetical protein
MFKPFGFLVPIHFYCVSLSIIWLWAYQMKIILESVVLFKLDIYALFLSMGRHLCWWTISPRWYHPPSSKCLAIDMVVIETFEDTNGVTRSRKSNDRQHSDHKTLKE